MKSLLNCAMCDKKELFMLGTGTAI